MDLNGVPQLARCWSFSIDLCHPKRFTLATQQVPVCTALGCPQCGGSDTGVGVTSLVQRAARSKRWVCRFTSRHSSSKHGSDGSRRHLTWMKSEDKLRTNVDKHKQTRPLNYDMLISFIKFLHKLVRPPSVFYNHNHTSSTCSCKLAARSIIDLLTDRKKI